MNKKLIAIAIAGAFVSASPALVMGAEMSTDTDMGDVSVNFKGFVDSVFTIQNEGLDDTATDKDGNVNSANPVNQKFDNSGEIDVMGGMGNVNVRIDLDVNSSAGGSGVSAEQAKISWIANDALTVNIGRQNSGVGFEGEDAPDLYQTSHGQLWTILDGQTPTLGGNNVEGLIVDFNAGPVVVNVGLLNDLHNVNEENSFLLSVGAKPMDGRLDLKVSFLTQADNTAANPFSVEDIIDAYAKFGMDNWFVNLELASYGVDGGPETAWGLTGHMDFGDSGFGLTARFDDVAYDISGVDDTTSATLAGSYQAAKNLSLLLEFRDNSNSDNVNFIDQNGNVLTLPDGSVITLEAVGTFGK